MPTESEYNRLRSELDAARHQLQTSNLAGHEAVATHTAARLGEQAAALKTQWSAAMAEGRFEEAAELSEKLAETSAARAQWSNSAAQYKQHREFQQSLPADPVEAYIAANRNEFSAEDQAWIRQHPSFATDKAVNARVIAAHHQALERGITPGLPNITDI